MSRWLHRTHFFSGTSLRRAICAKKDLIGVSKIFVAISDAFKDYPTDQYTFVQGKAVSVDPKKGTIDVLLAKGQSTTLNYLSLVIATGRKSNSPLWQVNDAGDTTRSEFATIQDQLQTAKSVLIAGGGPIGVETAGEIASRLSGVDVSLYSGSNRLLPRLLPSTSITAEERLKSLGVRVIHGQRCVSAPGAEKHLVHFDKDSPRTADVFIDATGGKPNSDFCPEDG